MSACEICARKGILVYPVRYAIACPAGAEDAPGLSGNFKIENAPSDIGKSKYTLRAMRAGYLYAYDEKRKRLRAYIVMPNGILFNFPTAHLPPAVRAAPTQACTNPAEVAFSRCIDIVHAAGDEATNLWLGWSNVAWTKPLVAKVEDAMWRRKHMQCISVAAMIAGTAGHTGEFARDNEKIAHFGMDKDAMLHAFGFSNTPTAFEVSQANVAHVLAETMGTHGPYHKGFIAAINDPVGICNDLSELTVPTADAGFDPDIARGKLVYDLLQAAETKIRAAARAEVMLDDNIAATYAAHPDKGIDVYNGAKKLWKIWKAGGLSKYREAQAAESRKYGNTLDGRANAQADRAWQDVISEEDHEQSTSPGAAGRNRKLLLDEARRAAFPAVYAEAIQHFEPHYDITVKCHRGWLESIQLAHWMEGVHDATDLVSGYAYSESVCQCIGKAVSSAPCSARLIDWLKAGIPTDAANLYGRALLFNNDELIAAAAPHLKGSDMQFENLLNVYKISIAKFDEQKALKLIDRLALGTANIFMIALSTGASSAASRMALMHLTLLGGPVLKLSNHSAKDVANWILHEADKKGIRFTVGKKQVQSSAYRVARNIVNADRTNMLRIEFNVAQLQAEGVINAGTIKVVKIPGFDMTEKWLGSSAPRQFHLGVVTAIVQLAALGFATQDLANNSEDNMWETRLKAASAGLSLMGTLVDTVGQVAQKAPAHPLSAFLKKQWAMTAERAGTVAKVGRLIGFAAGVAAGLYDLIWSTYSAWKEGQGELAVLYFTNGGLAIAVAWAGLAESMIFWPLLILSVAIGVVIAVMHSGDLQTWVSKCYFSKGVSLVRQRSKSVPPFQPYPYPTLKDELKAFNSAIGA